VTDGPFAEAKELITGFAIVQVRSKDEAVELAERLLRIAGDAETEIRQLFEPSDFSVERPTEPGHQAERTGTWASVVRGVNFTSRVHSLRVKAGDPPSVRFFLTVTGRFGVPQQPETPGRQC
jgi:hypothetical protein